MTARLVEAFTGLRIAATDYDAGLAARARQAPAPFGDRADVERADAAGLLRPSAGNLAVRFAARKAA